MGKPHKYYVFIRVERYVLRSPRIHDTKWTKPSLAHVGVRPSIHYCNVRFSDLWTHSSSTLTLPQTKPKPISFFLFIFFLLFRCNGPQRQTNRQSLHGMIFLRNIFLLMLLLFFFCYGCCLRLGTIQMELKCSLFIFFPPTTKKLKYKKEKKERAIVNMAKKSENTVESVPQLSPTWHTPFEALCICK